MISSFKQLVVNKKIFSSVIDDTILIDQYCPLDLSTSNAELTTIDITKHFECQHYIDQVLKRNHALVAFGGYLEQRNLYSDKDSFSIKGVERNIHLGLDFWTKAGTKVIAPSKGEVHSFRNNSTKGDYGPTIILKHTLEGFSFHTLFGHLSLASIENIQVGQEFEKGSVIGTLGTPDINVNYAPHLHFQIIIDMEGNFGDYPGVCSANHLDYYSQNCPDPSILLQLPS